MGRAAPGQLGRGETTRGGRPRSAPPRRRRWPRRARRWHWWTRCSATSSRHARRRSGSALRSERSRDQPAQDPHSRHARVSRALARPPGRGPRLPCSVDSGRGGSRHPGEPESSRRSRSTTSEALIALRRVDEAAALLEPLEERAMVLRPPFRARRLCPLPRPALAAHADLGARTGAVDEAIGHHERASRPFELARSLHALKA